MTDIRNLQPSVVSLLEDFGLIPRQFAEEGKKRQGVDTSLSIIDEISGSHKHRLLVDHRNEYGGLEEVTFKCRTCFYSVIYRKSELRPLVSGTSNKLYPITVKNHGRNYNA